MKSKMVLATGILLCLWVSNAIAYDFGNNITIYDNRTSGSAGTWYNRGINPGEDNEVEPGMVASQIWDLEGFFLNSGGYLSMVGGFNFKDGVSADSTVMRSGDIFLDTSDPLNATYGDSAPAGAIRNGYDYVIDLDFSNSTYNVYQITANTLLSQVLSYNRPYSNPWAYNHQSNQTSLYSGTFGFDRLTSSAFLGDRHYAVEGISLAFLPAGTEFISHFTMECGNDNLMGRASVPEPTTLLLLGLSLLGICSSARKLRKQRTAA